jgi:hypothetical protein
MPGIKGVNRKVRLPAACECGSHFFVPTSRWGIAIVSPGDEWLLREYCWTLYWPKSAPSIAYAISTRYGNDVGNSSFGYLHRAIFIEPNADHRDGNGLNCQRFNLRASTVAQNMQNRRGNAGTSSGYKGVSRTAEGRYRARLTQNDVETRLGNFDTPEEAARAYDAEALARWGEFARLNFPEKVHA